MYVRVGFGEMRTFLYSFGERGVKRNQGGNGSACSHGWYFGPTPLRSKVNCRGGDGGSTRLVRWNALFSWVIECRLETVSCMLYT